MIWSRLARMIFFRQQWQDHRKGTPLSRSAMNFQTSLMMFHKSTCNKQPQPESSRDCFRPFLAWDTVERFPDACKLIGCNSTTLIAHREDGLPLLALQAQRDGGARWGVFVCIGQQVQQNLAHP